MDIIKELGSLSSLLGCFLLATFFVGSLYVWKSPLDRNHPSIIKKRTISVMFVVLISPFITQFFITDEKYLNLSIWELHGFRIRGLLQATVLPLFLTMTLFLGPLFMEAFAGLWKFFAEPMFWVHYCDLIWLRNFVIAPFSEEFTFRACMLPILLQHFKPMTAIFVCPLFFGVAHAHHMQERMKQGIPFKKALIIALFQFSYTFLFGVYSALLFVKTGHFIAPFLAHSFCNMMGFPHFDEVLSYKNPKKIILIVLFISGIILWCLLLPPLTSPKLYDNDIYGKTNENKI